MDSATEVKRFLIEIERQIRQLNHDVLDPEIKEVSKASLQPALIMVAKARAHYLQSYIKLANEYQDSLPSLEEVKSLRTARVTYDELVHASQALETAISRGYITIKTEPKETPKNS